MVHQPSAFLRDEYVSRINQVLDTIDDHIGEELSLAMLAKVANFSPYHFHRLFAAIVGEPLSRYIHRIRLEKAALNLVAGPKDPIGQIAFRYGFPNQVSFSRAFKKHFGFTASQLRADPSLLKSKKCITESKHGNESTEITRYTEYDEGIQSATQPPTDLPVTIEVKDLRDLPVIYIRDIGMFGGDPRLFRKLLDKLFRWAGARGLLLPGETRILTVYHDNPDLTEDVKFRSSICLTVARDPVVDGGIGKMTIPGGRYAVGRFTLDARQFKAAWDHLFGSWLPESGYQPDDRPCFEIYLNNPAEHPEKKSVVEIYLPIKPM